MDNLPALSGENSLALMVAHVALLDRAIKQVMVRDVDYGIIPHTDKPTLLQPGAEKLLQIFRLAAVIPESRIRRVEDWETPFVMYEVVCQIVRQDTGEIVAEGIGNANLREPRFSKNRSRDQLYAIANTVLKMAKKRAMVDATKLATASSGRFTQDLEDTAESPRNGHSTAQSSEPAPNVERRNKTERKGDDAAHAESVRQAALTKYYAELVPKAVRLDIPYVELTPAMNPTLDEITAEAVKLKSAIGMRELELEVANAPA